MVPLGAIVEDNVTGARGVAVSRFSIMNGCVRIGVQPEAIGGTLPKYFTIDEQRAVVVGDIVCTPRPPASDIPAFGTRLKSKLAPVEGTLVAHTVTIGGEVHAVLARDNPSDRKTAEITQLLSSLEPVEIRT